MNKPRVLLIDDDELVLNTLYDQLSTRFDVTAVESGSKALAHLSNHSCDVVISDQVMPVMTGDELLAEVYRKWPDTERVLITGYADLTSVVRAVNHGRISYFIKKPWDLKQLLQVVWDCHERCLLRRKQVEDLQQARRQAEKAQIALEEVRRLINELVGVPRRRGLMVKNGGLVRQHVLKGIQGESSMADSVESDPGSDELS